MRVINCGTSPIPKKKLLRQNLVIRPSKETTSTERIYKAKLMDGNRSL